MSAHRKFFIAALILAVVYGYQRSRINPIVHKQKRIIQQIEQMGDWTSIENIAISAQSVIDALTWGAFAEEGVFTEGKKAKRQYEQLYRDYEDATQEINKCRYILLLGLFGSPICLVVGLVLRIKHRKMERLGAAGAGEHELPEHSGAEL